MGKSENSFTDFDEVETVDHMTPPLPLGSSLYFQTPPISSVLSNTMHSRLAALRYLQATRPDRPPPIITTSVCCIIALMSG